MLDVLEQVTQTLTGDLCTHESYLPTFFIFVILQELFLGLRLGLRKTSSYDFIPLLRRASSFPGQRYYELLEIFFGLLFLGIAVLIRGLYAKLFGAASKSTSDAGLVICTLAGGSLVLVDC
jgi:hypothetical protein